MDKCLWIGSGYPVFVAAVSILWLAYQKERKETRNAELLLIEEKDRHVRELEAFKKMVEDRQSGTGRK